MQRHFRNLKRLLPDCEINVYTHRRDDKRRIFDDKLNISYSDSFLRSYNIDNVFFDLNTALDSEKYDAIFIGTLPPERIDIAIKASERGIPIFIEKPLSNNLDKVYKLQEIIEENKLKCTMGFQMRFHPLLQKVKDMVDKKEFGDIYRIEVHHCNSIYNFTNGRDLSNFYALRGENGGGVLLSQIHEIDYLTWIFGKLYPVAAIYGQYLNIPNSDVEDNITILSNLELTNVCIPVILNLDFLSKIPTRTLKVFGTKDSIEVDLMAGFYKTPTKTGITTDSWNDLFCNEMGAFIGLINGKKQENLATLEDGIHSLEFCMDIKNNFTKVNL